MKKALTLLLSCVALTLWAQTPVPTATISGNITTNRTLSRDTIYTLSGVVYVKSGITLTIGAGTIIKALTNPKTALVVNRGGKLIANGTATAPIVFTSAQPIGNRAPQDWGGVVICGKAPTNQTRISGGVTVQGEGEIEGGVAIPSTDDGIYGGTDAADNSGSMRYCRIEFAGFPFLPNNELNGLTLGAVGNGTTIEYIQVSYSGDDSFEWFGGTVNCKYLVAFAGTDDDFDTDNGFSGTVQFGVGQRNPNYFDAAGQSNGFESDNNAGSTGATPLTAAVFSNMTIAGPKATPATAINGIFGNGALLRRNTTQSVFNSIIMGYRFGLDVDGRATAGQAVANNALRFKNNVLAGNEVNFVELDSLQVPGIRAWFSTAGSGNDSSFTAAAASLTAPFDTLNPNFLPTAASPMLSGAAFTDSKLANNPNITQVTYRGAFGTTNWMAGWTNFRPLTTNYNIRTSIETFAVSDLNAKLYPNPTDNSANLDFALANEMQIALTVVDMYGKVVTAMAPQKFAAGSHSLRLDLSNVAAGMYFVRFLGETAQKVLPLTVVK